MIKEAESSLKIPLTFCHVHTDRSVLSVCLDSDCQYRGMFCYQCIKYHYKHIDKTFEIKEFLNLINENINDLSFNMLPTSPSPQLKDIYKNKYEQISMNKDHLLRQKELVIEAVTKYVEKAIEIAENKVDQIESKSPASQDTMQIQELTSYQEKFFDLGNLQPDELYDLLIFFSRFIHKEDDKIEIITQLASNSGQIPKHMQQSIEGDLDSTCQNLRNSELVLQKLTGILDHLPPDDKSAHQKLSCLKIAPQQTPRRFGQPQNFQSSNNSTSNGYNSYHHNSVSLSNHFQRANSNGMNNESNHNNHRNAYPGNNNYSNSSNNGYSNQQNNGYNNQQSNNQQSSRYNNQQNSGQNSSKFNQYLNSNNQNSNNNITAPNNQSNKDQSENNTNSNQDNSENNTSNNGANNFLSKFQQKLNENKSDNPPSNNSLNNSFQNNNSQNSSSQNNGQNNTTNSNQQSTSSNNQNNNSNQQTSTTQQNNSKSNNQTKQQQIVSSQNSQQNQSSSSFNQQQSHFQQSSQQSSNSQNQNDSRQQYQQKKQQNGNSKRNEILSEQRLGLRSVEHFCDALEVGFNNAWCVSFKTSRECALNGFYHLPIFIYDSTVGASLETAHLNFYLFEGSGSFSKKLYDQTVILKKTNKHISPDETNIMNVLEKISINTSYKLRKNSEYTIVIRNKTSEQEDPSSHKQLYILYGDDQADELKNQPESEGSKLISYIKTNTTNISQALDGCKLITQNNDSLDDPQLTDYFIPYLSLAQLNTEQQYYKNNYYSSSNTVEEENDQKTPKRQDYEHSQQGSHYNSSQNQRGFKDFLNTFKNGTGFNSNNNNSQMNNTSGNNQSNENDFNKYNRNNAVVSNKRKYMGSGTSQREYSGSSNNNTQNTSQYNSSSNNSNNNGSSSTNNNSSQYQSTNYSNNTYEKSSIISGFVPQKKQKK